MWRMRHGIFSSRSLSYRQQIIRSPPLPPGNLISSKETTRIDTRNSPINSMCVVPLAAEVLNQVGFAPYSRFQGTLGNVRRYFWLSQLENTIGIWGMEAKDFAQHSTKHSTAPNNKELYGSKCQHWEITVAKQRKLSTEELMLLNCGVREDFWESLGLQGDPNSPS